MTSVEFCRTQTWNEFHYGAAAATPVHSLKHWTIMRMEGDGGTWTSMRRELLLRRQRILAIVCYRKQSVITSALNKGVMIVVRAVFGLLRALNLEGRGRAFLLPYHVCLCCYYYVHLKCVTCCGYESTYSCLSLAVVTQSAQRLCYGLS